MGTAMSPKVTVPFQIDRSICLLRYPPRARPQRRPTSLVYRPAIEVTRLLLPTEGKTMAPSTLQEQLVKYLTDVHSIEQQALIQMKLAPAIAGDPQLAEHFRRHRAETEEQKRRVEERLQKLGAGPAMLKDVAGMVTGIGFALFAKFNPDTPGKLVAHGYSYEHMEMAAYALLANIADRAGDAETAAAAR